MPIRVNLVIGQKLFHPNDDGAEAELGVGADGFAVATVVVTFFCKIDRNMEKELEQALGEMNQGAVATAG